MRLSNPILFALPLALALGTACSKDETPDAGPVDVGVPDSGVPPDSGIFDATTPDTGPLPCIWDQGGVENRGCDPGEVCNLAMDPPQCVAGTACTTDGDCNRCSALQNSSECGHGFHLTAWCDTNHGSVCTRSRAPCEACAEDRDCGRTDPLLGGGANRCLDYGNNEKFCSRACTQGCPDGFACNAEGQCFRQAGCEPFPIICPESDMPGVGCAGTDQICPGEVCPDTGGARCSTNNQPGALGICIGFCTQNSDCPADLPVCNTRNGICIAGCTAGSCPAGQVCHSDGFCAGPCTDNAYCEMDDRYGADTYCNVPAQPPPRIYKSYRDENACAPLGCERPIDCPVAGLVCDKTLAPPACVQGCYEREDCLSGFICKSGPQGNYNREQCRALATKTDDSEIGVCCNPGCTSRALQCAIGEYCCSEEGSPYEDPNACITVTSTGGPQAQPGQCFEMPVDPWCQRCDRMMDPPCDSGWTPGFNTDPAFNNGQPFQEQEFCFSINPMGGAPAMCSVTCDPDAADNACPRGWNCAPYFPTCLQDADCGAGLTCINENTAAMPPVRGQCKCGTNGVPDVACPLNYAGLMEPVRFPRCVDYGNQGDMICIASYHCAPRQLEMDAMGNLNYPAACDLQ